MGRTVPTYRMVLEQHIKKWDRFRRALRKEDRDKFDKMMNKARMHSSASIFSVHMDPIESMFMSILLEQEKEIEGLKDQIDDGDVSGEENYMDRDMGRDVKEEKGGGHE